MKNSFIKVKLEDNNNWVINLDYVTDVWFDSSKNQTFVQFLNEDEPRIVSGKEVFDAIFKYTTSCITLNESALNGNKLDKC